MGNIESNTKVTKQSKHQNGKIPHSTVVEQPESKSNDQNNQINQIDHHNDDDQKDDEVEYDELSEEEALRMAMEMSMTAEDRELAALVSKEIGECQRHLSQWFAGSFKSVKAKNM